MTGCEKSTFEDQGFPSDWHEVHNRLRMDTLAPTSDLEPMNWGKMSEQMFGRKSRGARLSAATKRDSAEMASQQVMAHEAARRGVRHVGRDLRNGCADEQMPARWHQIAVIKCGVRALPCFTVCHPVRPNRIGSGNRRRMLTCFGLPRQPARALMPTFRAKRQA